MSYARSGSSSVGSSPSVSSSSAHSGSSQSKTTASGSASARPTYGQSHSGNARPSARRPPSGKSNWKKGPRSDAQKTPDPILFQTYFKSVGPRTYAAQLKRAGNGNHYLVFTEGKRDKVTDEVRKTSVYVFSEDFISFFKMFKETAEHVKSHPVPAEVAQKRTKFWQKQSAQDAHSKPGEGDKRRCQGAQ